MSPFSMKGTSTRILGGRGSSLVIVRPKMRMQVVFGPSTGEEVVGGGGQLMQVGTQQGNILRLNDDAVSRIHFEICSTDWGIKIRDLASTNGTWLLDGVRLTEGYLPSETVVRVGRSHIRIQALEEEEAEALSQRTGFGLLRGQSAQMRALFALMERIAPTDETVLITGETGTGKELCSRSLVEASRRADQPFEVVDCGSIPHNLLESELFGHVRGAFTGAIDDYIGAFERADKGTIFLDELGELPLPLQTRLLRVVENRTIRRIGSPHEVPLDVRILAATNRRLEEEVNHGGFRADLYYRLSVVQLRLPPLRERGEDIALLAAEILEEQGLDCTSYLDETLLQQLRCYRWPGNVRELRNYLRRMTYGVDFPSLLPAVSEPVPHPHAAAPDATSPRALATPLPSFKEAKEAAIAAFEREYLQRLITQANGNVSQAARLARTDRAHMSRLLSKHCIRSGR
jgi:DNA-binding NtrC family response regulator